MVTTLKSIFWAAILMYGLFTTWSIVTLDLLHGVVKELAAEGEYKDCGARCEHALDSVFKADLMSFEMVVLGEGFGEFVFPIVQRSPWTIILFLGIFFVV